MQQEPYFKRRRGTCTFSTPGCDYSSPQPKSFNKRRKQPFSTSMVWQAAADAGLTLHVQDTDGAEMQTPASHLATTTTNTPRDESQTNHDPTERRNSEVAENRTADDTETVKPKLRSSLSSNLSDLHIRRSNSNNRTRSKVLVRKTLCEAPRVQYARLPTRCRDVLS